MRLLPDRPPSTITGRELAAEAGVNYGLVHHYFGGAGVGGKEAILRKAIARMRDEFLERHPVPARLPLLVGEREPFLMALARAQVDYPSALGPVDSAGIGKAVTDVVERRAGAPSPEVQARVIALVGLQVACSTFQAMLLDVARVRPEDQAAVEAELQRLYRGLALAAPSDHETTAREAT